MALETARKSSVEKCGIAWLVRKRTCVSNEWIKQRLQMGKATNFAALVKRFDTGGKQEKPVRRKLENIKISD